MSFGKMNAFATILSRTVGKDSEGFKSETEHRVAAVRCYHEGRHGSRFWANLAAFSTATDLFVMRASALTVQVGWIIECGGERYKIVSVENIKGRGMYLEVLAERTVSALG